jgi:hypothetical protein
MTGKFEMDPESRTVFEEHLAIVAEVEPAVLDLDFTDPNIVFAVCLMAPLLQGKELQFAQGSEGETTQVYSLAIDSDTGLYAVDLEGKPTPSDADLDSIAEILNVADAIHDRT